jgi:hypothetical protein
MTLISGMLILLLKQYTLKSQILLRNVSNVHEHGLNVEMLKQYHLLIIKNQQMHYFILCLF